MVPTLKWVANPDEKLDIDLFRVRTSASLSNRSIVAMVSTRMTYRPLQSFLFIHSELLPSFPISSSFPYYHALPYHLPITFTVSIILVSSLCKDHWQVSLMCTLKCLYEQPFKKDLVPSIRIQSNMWSGRGYFRVYTLWPQCLSNDSNNYLLITLAHMFSVQAAKMFPPTCLLSHVSHDLSKNLTVALMRRRCKCCHLVFVILSINDAKNKSMLRYDQYFFRQQFHEAQSL